MLGNQYLLFHSNFFPILDSLRVGFVFLATANLTPPCINCSKKYLGKEIL